jgi:hypothetical protein
MSVYFGINEVKMGFPTIIIDQVMIIIFFMNKNN